MKRIDPAFVWWLVAALGFSVLPWHMAQEKLALAGYFAAFADDVEAASALSQAAAHGRWWFWPVGAALALAVPAFVFELSRGTRADWLLAA
ncbi:MAG: hypothetical protein ACK5U4_12055, partial [Rhodospirillales bacterium]